MILILAALNAKAVAMLGNLVHRTFNSRALDFMRQILKIKTHPLRKRPTLLEHPKKQAHPLRTHASQDATVINQAADILQIHSLINMDSS